MSNMIVINADQVAWVHVTCTIVRDMFTRCCPHASQVTDDGASIASSAQAMLLLCGAPSWLTLEYPTAALGSGLP